MAYDKVVDSAQLDADLSSIANAIRKKGGTSKSLAFPNGFVDAVGAISGGGASVTITDDGNGNVTISGMTVTDDDGNVTIGG